MESSQRSEKRRCSCPRCPESDGNPRQRSQNIWVLHCGVPSVPTADGNCHIFFTVQSDKIMTLLGGRSLALKSSQWPLPVETSEELATCRWSAEGLKTAQAETNVPNGLHVLCCFDVMSHERKNKSSLNIMSLIWASSSSGFPPRGSSGLCRQPSVHDLHDTKKQMRSSCCDWRREPPLTAKRVATYGPPARCSVGHVMQKRHQKPQWLAFFILLQYKNKIIWICSYIPAVCCSGTKILLLVVSRHSSLCCVQLGMLSEVLDVNVWVSGLFESCSALFLLATSLHNVAPSCVYIANSMKLEPAAILPLLFLLHRTLERLLHIKESWSRLHFMWHELTWRTSASATRPDLLI